LEGVTKDDWCQIVDVVRAEIDPRVSAYVALRFYSVCPLPLFTRLSIEMWNLYNALGGMQRLSRLSDYYALPAIYVEGCKIIEGELKRVEKAQQTDGR
jgi:hypothetical protein